MATDEIRALVDEIESQRETIRDLLAALDDMIAELHTLRARVVELEEDRQTERDRILGARVREVLEANGTNPERFVSEWCRAQREAEEGKERGER